MRKSTKLLLFAGTMVGVAGVIKKMMDRKKEAD